MTNSTSSTITTGSSPTADESPTDPENSIKGEKKKKIFSSKKSSGEISDEDYLHVPLDFNKKLASKAIMDTKLSMKENYQKRQSSAGIEGLNLSNFDQPMAPETIIQDIRVFVATWNVGGTAPDHDLRLEEFLQVEGSSDIYVLGFQEIVPLNAVNVLVVEDNEPAAKWLALISHALNKSYHESMNSSSSESGFVSKSNNSKDSRSHFFHKPSLKVLSRNLRADNTLLKACNCSLDSPSSSKRRPRNLSDPCNSPVTGDEASFDGLVSESEVPSSCGELNYCVVASKQMVGLFLSVWARKELVQHLGHLRVDCVGRGIMGCLGNKGCISIRFSLHQTSFCIVCSHLASGEKEGDEPKRNNDVVEILKSTQFTRTCKNPNNKMPENILDHDRVIWLGDLNYRVALSYEEARVLLEDNDWDSLLEKDQLNLEREAGRVFYGWSEGKILFAPTYKYSHNSDSYAGETGKSKKKRRTPAWCDRILWHSKGIEQLSYIRGESRFSDHRPVCAVFTVEVEAMNNKTTRFMRKGNSCIGARTEYEKESIHRRHSFYGY